MGWQRRRGGMFFYVTRRLPGGRFRCEYLGNGLAAEAAASLMLLAREERLEARARRQAARQREEQAVRHLRGLAEVARLLSRATLLAAGYRRHDRGEWRRWRMGMDALKTDAGDNGAGEGLEGLVRRAERGDASALPALRKLLDAEPAVWRHAGDMARIAEDSAVALAAGGNLLLRECLSRQLVELKAALAGPEPSLIDRLLAERAAICWLWASYSDAAYAQAKGAAAPALEHALKRQGSASRRYAEALKLLATVQRLLRPKRETPARGG